MTANAAGETLGLEEPICTSGGRQTCAVPMEIGIEIPQEFSEIELQYDQAMLLLGMRPQALSLGTEIFAHPYLLLHYSQ